jgi:hypothetical protein
MTSTAGSLRSSWQPNGPVTGSVETAVRQGSPDTRPLTGGPHRSLATLPSAATELDPHDRTVRSWPLLVLALPAAVAVWSGWVGIGQMTGFGQVHPLPGIWGTARTAETVTPTMLMPRPTRTSWLRPKQSQRSSPLRGSAISRRTLRRAGIHGSNADLGHIAHIVKPQTYGTSAATDKISTQMFAERTSHPRLPAIVAGQQSSPGADQ